MTYPANDSVSRDEAPTAGLVRGSLPRIVAILVVPALTALVAYGSSFLLKPVYTSRVTFLPPQQQQSAAAAAVASMGALSSLVGSSAGLRSPAEQYVALLQSASIAERLIEEFKLRQVYGVSFVVDARERLAKNVHIAVGKADGIVSIEVDDERPSRAADIANRHVDELRRLTGKLALSEAQQRRAFFESHLLQTRDRLAAAQRVLQSSGIDAGTLKAEPKAAAEGYSRLRAEATTLEIRLQSLRQSLTDVAPEVQQVLSMLAAVRKQMAAAEVSESSAGGADYIGKYREFKYQEALFEMFSRQYEMARVDESREGAMIQVIDAATPGERPTRPRRHWFALGGAGIGAGALLVWIVFAPALRRRSDSQAAGVKADRLRKAFDRA